jgi:hypothetical protein
MAATRGGGVSSLCRPTPGRPYCEALLRSRKEKLGFATRVQAKLGFAQVVCEAKLRAF